MFHIVVAILLGVTVGFLFARYVVAVPSQITKTFGSLLKRCGLTGGVIGAPIIAYLTLFDEFTLKEECLIAYFIFLLVTAIITIISTALLLIRSVLPDFIPPKIIKSYRRYLILDFLGYPGVKRKLQAIENLVEGLINRGLTTENISKEEKDLCDELKMTPQDLKQIREAARKHFSK